MIERDTTPAQPTHIIEKDVSPVEREPIMLERITVQHQAPVHSAPHTYAPPAPHTYAPPVEEEIVVPSKKENEATLPKLDIEVSERPTITRARESPKAPPTGKNTLHSSE